MNINGREIKSIVHLHNHTDFSLLDSIIKVKNLVKFAKDHELPAIAITDHGDFSGYVNFYKECKKNGIKPILGCEIYEVEDYEENRENRSHLILLAKNETGFRNINKILTKGAENFFYKPIITIDDIKKEGLGEGLICTTACLGGKIPRGLKCGLDMKPFLKKLQNTFDEVFIEIQSHNTEDQIEGNGLLIDFAKKNNVPLVVSTDAHMVNEEDGYYHDLFVSIGQGREAGEYYTDCYLQNIEQTITIMKNIGLSKEIFIECVENTYKISDMIEEYDIGLNEPNQMPHVEIPSEFKDALSYFKHLVYTGIDEKIKKYGLNKDEYYKRLELEIDVLIYVDYIEYFLLMRQAIIEGRKRKIPLGYGRGSVGGCLCAYAMDISKTDSIRWDLNFARFANKGRKSLADIDLDISQKRRQEMIELTKEMFGHDYVAPMATFGTFTTKSAIRDIGKVLNDREDSPYYQQIPSSLRKEVMNMIPTIKTFDDITGEGQDKEMALNDILESNSNLKEVNSKFPKWMEAVLKLEGLTKTKGCHASGILVSPKPLSHYAPLSKGKDGMVFSLEMHNAQDDLKLVKLDYLGLRNLDIADETIKSIGKTWDDFDIDSMNLDDKDVLRNIFEKANSEGVFQCESLEARKMLLKMKFESIEDAIALLALNRPGAKDSFPTYLDNQKYSYEEKKVIHEDLRPIFAKTQGILLYQEQTLSTFALAGFPEERIDNARRAVGKKDAEEMAMLKVDFQNGLFKRGWTQNDVDVVWHLMELQAKYSFNRSHSVSYGLLSYLTAYLKYHHTLEFQTALLNSVIGDYPQITRYISDSNQNGIKVLPPHINKSGQHFTFDNETNTIRFGFEAIKGIGVEISNNIIDIRPFKSIDDIKERLKPKVSQYIALIKSGAIGTSKEKLLQEFIDSKTARKPYKPVVSLPSIKKLREEFGIESDSKEERLSMYNKLKEISHEESEDKRVAKEQAECERKYWGVDKRLWEFEALSMFVTNNPFEYVNTLDFTQEEFIPNLVTVGVIADIQNKKDKKGKKFVFFDLFTKHGKIEATCFAGDYVRYQKLIEKGKAVVVKGNYKAETKSYVVNGMKDFFEWEEEKQLKGKS